MKTKTIFIVTLLAIAFSATAQEKRSIETVVSDTIKLRALQFKYEVTVGDDYSYSYDYPNLKTAFDSLKTATISDVEDILKKAGFKWSATEENNYTISKSSKGRQSVTVTLKSKSELDRLYHLLDTMKGVTGKITNTDYEAPSLYRDEMFRRLYDKALIEATAMAKISGTEISRLVSASESFEQSTSYLDWLTELSKYSGSDIWGLNTAFYKIYTRRFAFKFELK